MARRQRNSERWDSAQTIATAMHHQDQAVAEQVDRAREQRATMALAQIKDRLIDTRVLRQQHVAALAESIAILGLLEPLVIDIRHRLLAGGHRLEAIRLLKRSEPEAYSRCFRDDLIPVRIMPFDAESDPERALQCEIAENEHRRDYTPAEVRALAERLRASGYNHQRGRPNKGAKSLGPALEVIIGKHRRTVQRYLQQSSNEKIRQDVVFSDERNALQRIRKALEEWDRVSIGKDDTPKRRTLAKELPRLLKLVDAALKEESMTLVDSPDSQQ